MCLRFSLNISYYCLYYNMGNFGLSIFLIQFLFGAIEIPANLLAFWLLEVLGRKILFMSTLLTGGLCCIFTLAIPQGKPFGLVYKMKIKIFWSYLTCLIVLLFSRKRHSSFMSKCCRTFFPNLGWFYM